MNRFSNAIRNNAIIAEVKRASPSAGVLRDDFDHIEIAKIYNQEKVNAISVITSKHFQGKLDLKIVGG